MSDEGTALTTKEMDLVRKIAERDGITIDEAASRLFSARLASVVKKRTGRAPAKVYNGRRK